MTRANHRRTYDKMLSFFRRGFMAKIMLVILVIGLFAIVITGFGTGGSGGRRPRRASGTTVASVGGEELTLDEADATRPSASSTGSASSSPSSTWPPSFSRARSRRCSISWSTSPPPRSSAASRAWASRAR